MEIKTHMDLLASLWHRRTSSRIKPAYVILTNLDGTVIGWELNKHIAIKRAADYEPAAYVLEVRAKLVKEETDD